MILLTQSGYDPGRDILARCAAVSASVGAPAPMVHLLPAEAAEAPVRSETYIEQVYHITQTLETNYLVNLQMDLRFLTLKLDSALRQLARVEQDAARMHASAPRSDEKAPKGKAAAPAAAEPVPRSAPVRAAISAARPLALLDLARTRALEPLEISVLRAQENRERAGSQPQSAERVLLSAPPAAPVQDAPVRRAPHPVSALQPVHPAASEKPAAPSRPAVPAQTVLRTETPSDPQRPAAVHSGSPAQTGTRRDERSTDLKLPVPPVSAAPAARDIRTAQTTLPATETALQTQTASPAVPAQNPAVPNTAAAQTLPAARPLAPAPTLLRTESSAAPESARTAGRGTPKASSAAPAQTVHAAPPAQTVSRAEPAQSAQPPRAQNIPSAPAPLGAQASAPLTQRRPLGHFEPQEGQETAAPPAYAPVPGRMAADRVLRRDAAAQEQRRTQVSRTMQTPQKAHSAQAAPAARTASAAVPAAVQALPAQTAPAQPIAAPAPLVYAQPRPAGEPPETPSAAEQTAAPAHSTRTVAPAPLVHAQPNPPAAAARNAAAPPQTSPRDFARQVSGKYAAAPGSPAVHTVLTPRAGITAAQMSAPAGAAAVQPSASAGTMARANAASAVPAAFAGPAAMEFRRETAPAASGAEQAEENDIKTVRRTRTVKQETLPAEVKTAVNASGAQLPVAAAPVRVAPAEVERIADKVYRQIEARLRSEKARRGM